jgi:hypothetical protein
VDETDCSNLNVTATPGELGNRCHVDCANQGICDFKTGTCRCFDGQYGTDCSLQLEVPASLYSSGGIYTTVTVMDGGDPGSSGYLEDSWSDIAGTD